MYDQRDTQIYDKELGRNIELIQYFKNEFGNVEYTPNCVRVDDKLIPVEEVEPWYLPHRVLGMTNGLKIWLRKGLEYIGRKFVLEHEKEHVRDMLADEDTIDRRAMARLRLAYRPI